MIEKKGCGSLTIDLKENTTDSGREQTCDCKRGKGREGAGLGGWDRQMQPIICRMDNNRSYCVAQGIMFNTLQ